MTPSPLESGMHVRQSSKRRSCPKCHRWFDRSDSLLRHMQVHDEHRILKSRRRTACTSCSKSKIKCTGEQPSCTSCSRRQIGCVYESNSKALPEALHNGVADRPSPPTSNYSRQDMHMNLDQQVSPSQPPRTTDLPNFGFLDPIGNNHESPMSANRLPSTMPAAQLSSTFDSDFTNLIGATDLNANLDWLFDSASSEDVLAFGDLDLIHDTLGEIKALSGQPLRETTRFDNSNALPPGDTAIPDLPTIPPSEDSCSPDDPWPMEWHAEYCQRRLELPVLGAREGQDAQFLAPFFHSWNLQSSTVDQLAQYIEMPAQRSPWQPSDLRHFPSKEMLELCIDRYFAHFQKIWPLIHQPTFDPGRVPTVTLAIASIGALYTNLSEARSFSNTLSELNRRLLLFMAEYDRRYVRTESYLMTQLLQGLHGYCSGNKRLFELSESFRNNLVHHAKCIGLFDHRPGERPGALSDLSPEERWKDWIRQEQRHRLGWAIYKYDASVSYLHNNRPFLTVGDMLLDLPCAPQYWSAESAHCWLSMLTSPLPNPKSPNLRACMRTCLDKTRGPKDLQDEEHRYTIILTLTRMMWTLKDMTAAPINEFVDVSPEYLAPPVFDALESFVQSPQKLIATLTTEEMARAMHSQQVIHIAHLYGAGTLMNWLFPLLRHANKATVAQLNLNLWAAQNPEEVRKAAYHSAQVLALARTYPSNSPNEPFIIFQAGTILFYLAKLLVEQEASDTFIPIKLDYLDTDDGDTETYKLKVWIQTGQASRIGLHGLQSICCETGRRYVLEQTVELLRRRTIWGIADSFVTVVMNLRDSFQHS